MIMSAAPFSTVLPVSAPGMHLVVILSLLFAVAMFRLGRKDP